MTRVLLVLLLLLCPAVSSALVSEGRPGIPYFNHVFFLDQKVVEGGEVDWVTLAYVDTREQTLECRNKVDVFGGKELFAQVPEKSWILVDYELQSILVEAGFTGDADVFKVTPCADVDTCCALRDRLNADPEQSARRAQHTRPAKTKTVRLGDIEDQLETGRQLVKAARCRGCHSVEGFGAAHAPSLTWKRYKYEKGWLEAYLRAPYRLRPAMTDLMMLKFTSPNAQPSLQPAEADAVADYLAKVAWTKSPAERFRSEPWAGYDCYDCHTKLYREEPLTFVPTPVPAPIRERLDTSAVLQSCLACHAFGGYREHPVVPGQLNPFTFATDLLLAVEKLETNYFISYVRDPNYLEPGSSMPKLGLNEKQLEELKALVLAIKESIASGELQPVHNFYGMKKRD
jgi:mono/diheme cytochrome c family protein